LRVVHAGRKGGKGGTLLGSQEIFNPTGKKEKKGVWHSSWEGVMPASRNAELLGEEEGKKSPIRRPGKDAGELYGACSQWKRGGNKKRNNTYGRYLFIRKGLQENQSAKGEASVAREEEAFYLGGRKGVTARKKGKVPAGINKMTRTS